MAGPISLSADLGTRGAFRYCEYSNGKVYMFDSGKTCPASMQEPAADGKGIGIFRGESNEGTSKLCIYRVGGQERSIRIDVHAQCPLNQEF
jgi:hypothetical protein